MRHKSRRLAISRALSGALFAALLLVGGGQVVTTPARADDLEDRAKDVAAEHAGVSRDQLRIVQTATATYPNAGVSARAFKVRNDRTGTVESILLDTSGRTLDQRSVERTEQQAVTSGLDAWRRIWRNSLRRATHLVSLASTSG